MATPPENPSVTAPVGQAIERVKQVLFRPFDIGKWFIIGFCAWLAHLGEEGFNSGFNYHFGNKPGESLEQVVDRAKDFITDNLYWMLPLLIALAVMGLVLWLVFTWLSSRGKFMFVHCVALNRAEVAVPWNYLAQQGNSLFWFRVVLGLAGMALILPMAVFIVVSVMGMVRAGSPTVAGIFTVAALVLATMLVGVIFAIVTKLTNDFAVPLMFLRRNRCLQAWSELGRMLASNAGEFVLYLLFQIVLALIIGVMIFIVILATCCTAACFLAIPFLGTVILLPVLVFKRAYSLHYFAQFGPAYDAFALQQSSADAGSMQS